VNLRIAWLLLALAGCGASGPPAGPNLVGPEPPAPGPPAMPLSAEAHAMLESVERPFREPGVVIARLGEEVAVGNVRVRPIAVLEDTRCPIDLECVHGGTLRLRVAVSGLGETEMQLWQPLPIPGSAPLRLVAVAPPRWHEPPAGVDQNAPPRFGFRRIEADQVDLDG
jgi:hypothetical protein